MASTVQVPPLGNRTSERLDVPDSERSFGQALRDVSVSAPAITTSAALLSDDVRLNSARSESVSTSTPTRPTAQRLRRSRRATDCLRGRLVLTTDDRDHPSRRCPPVGPDVVDRHARGASYPIDTVDQPRGSSSTQVEDAMAVRARDPYPTCAEGAPEQRRHGSLQTQGVAGCRICRREISNSVEQHSLCAEVRFSDQRRRSSIQ